MLFGEPRGLTKAEVAALNQARQSGYLRHGHLADGIHVGFQADESWWQHCTDEGIPYLTIGGVGPHKVIIVDLETVYTRHPRYSHVLAPTTKAQLRLSSIIKGAQLHYGGIYTQLKGVEAARAEQVASAVLQLWLDYRQYSHTVSLWEQVTNDEEKMVS